MNLFLSTIIINNDNISKALQAMYLHYFLHPFKNAWGESEFCPCLHPDNHQIRSFVIETSCNIYWACCRGNKLKSYSVALLSVRYLNFFVSLCRRFWRFMEWRFYQTFLEYYSKKKYSLLLQLGDVVKGTNWRSWSDKKSSVCNEKMIWHGLTISKSCGLWMLNSQS